MWSLARPRRVAGALGAALLVASGCGSSARCPVCPAAARGATSDAGSVADARPVTDARREKAAPITLFDLSRKPRTVFRSACERARSLGKTTVTENGLRAKFSPGNALSILVRFLEEERSKAAPEDRAAWDDLVRRMAADPTDPRNEWLVFDTAPHESYLLPPDESPLPDGREVAPVGASAACVEAGNATWRVIDALYADGGYGVRVTDDGRAEVFVYAAKTRGLGYVPLEGAVKTYWPEGLPSGVDVVVRDLDGDGKPEGIVRTGGEDARFWFGTVKEDYARPFALLIENGRGRYAPDETSGPTRGERLSLVDVADRTGDGRLDLVLAPIVSVSGCGAPIRRERLAFEIVAEGRPDGRFDLRTKAAIAHAKRQCPAAPARFADPIAIACAKLWGVPDWQIARGAGIENEQRRCAEPPGGSIETASTSVLRMRLPFRLTEL